MKTDRKRALIRIVTGVAAAILLLAATTPAPRKPGVYVKPRHRASQGAIYSGRSAAKALAPGETVNLNTADFTELECLEGIGETTAQAIVAYRKAHGPFRSAEELTLVKGIGEGTLERIRPYITVE